MTHEEQKLIELLSDVHWRMNHLYFVKNKQGQVVKFKMNWAQNELLDGMHTLNIIPKSRQIGISTFICLYFLDFCLFTKNKKCGQICDELKNAKEFLTEKIEFAYQNIAKDNPELQKLIFQGVQVKRFSRSSDDSGIWFSNGSSIQVGTSFRSGTLQKLHISEYAKICKKYPIKAEEIRNGALNTVATGQQVFIESTSEGAEGEFYEITTKAKRLRDERKELSLMDYKLFFFPWWKQKEYSLDVEEETRMNDYFDKLEGKGIKLTKAQKLWYEKKYEILQEDTKKEYPSSVEECFEASDKDKYYLEQVTRLRRENKVVEFSYDPAIEVHTWWDLGRSDYTSIGFFQFVGKEIRCIDFLEEEGEHISFYAQKLKEKGYVYGTCHLPHDARNELLSAEKNVYTQLAEYGFKCDIVPKTSIEIGISELRNILPEIYFLRSKTGVLLEHLEKYKKKWNPTLGQFVGQVHDEHSHAADMMRYFASSNTAKISSAKEKKERREINWDFVESIAF